MPLRSLNYLPHFRCSADRCPDTCCANWNIFIDLATLERFVECDDPELTEKLKANITLEKPEDMTPARAGRFRMLGAKRSCAFLATDTLCSLQRDSGEKYLACLCHRFPREENIVDSWRERSATVACPEVAKLVLFAETPLAFVEYGEPDRWEHLLHRNLDTALPSAPAATAHFHLIRAVMLECLQDRRYALTLRLERLWQMCSWLGSLIEEGRISEIPHGLEMQVNLPWPAAACEARARQEAGLFFLLQALCDLELIEKIQLPAYQGQLALLRAEFSPVIAGVGRSEAKERFQAIEDGVCAGFHARHPHAHESLLSNNFLKQLFPFDEGRSIAEQYEELLIYLALTRIHLSAAGKASGELSDDKAVEALYTFARTWDTNSAYRELMRAAWRQGEPAAVTD